MHTASDILPIPPVAYPEQIVSAQGSYMHPFSWHATNRVETLVALYRWAVAVQAARTITIQEISLGQGILRRHTPLTLSPHTSDCGKHFTVEVEDIEMDITETSVEGLKNAVEAVLGMKWKRYAEGDPAKMTLGAQGIRERLRAMYSYDPGA